MSSLYELTEDLVALDRLLAELGGEVTEGTEGQTLERWANEYEWKMRDKVDGYAALIRNLEADRGALEEEVGHCLLERHAHDLGPDEPATAGDEDPHERSPR